MGDVVREPVEEPRRLLDDVDRQLRERVALGARLEPEKDVAFDPEMRREEGHEPSEPRARGDHQALRVVASGGRRHADAVVCGLPSLDRLGEAQRRTVSLGLPKVRLDRALRCEPPGLFLVEADPAVGPLEQWKAPTQRRGVEDLVRESMRARARERSAHQLAGGRARVEAAGLRQEGLAARALELAPEVPRAAEQRNVVRVLVVREPDDPREPAGGAERVSARETLEAEHRRAALRQVIGGRAAVRAKPRDDDVDRHAEMVPVGMSTGK